MWQYTLFLSSLIEIIQPQKPVGEHFIDKLVGQSLVCMCVKWWEANTLLNVKNIRNFEKTGKANSCWIVLLVIGKAFISY